MGENKVCFLTSSRPHNDTRIYYREAVSLRRMGYDVTIVCPDCQTTDEKGIRFRVAEIDFASHLKKLVKGPFRVLNRAIDENADVYHFHDSDLIHIGFFLKLFGKKVVYDVREDMPQAILGKEWIPKRLRMFCSKLFEGIEWLLCRTYDGIVVPSERIAKRFPKRKTIVVGNYPEIGEFPGVIPDFEQRQQMACMIGVVQEDGGVSEVLESSRYLDCPILITGRIYSHRLSEQLNERKEGKKLQYLGFLERREVLDLLLQARVGLAPIGEAEYYSVGVPSKIFEYMICEIPVIASDFPEWRELLEDSPYGQCGMCVDSGDPQALAKAVSYLLSNEDEAMRMGLNGRRAVLEHYNWEQEFHKLSALYEKLLPLSRETESLAQAE